MSSLKRLLIVAALALVAVAPIRAAIDVKLATLVPPGTAWANALFDLASTWSKDTEARVTLTIYPGGIQGSEQTVLSKMRPSMNTLQATFITTGGLASLDKAFNVFNIPFFFENDAQQLAVQTALAPQLTERLNAKGLHLLCWGNGGWVQVFSKKPLRSLADLKAAKLWTSKDDDQMLQWYVSNGFHPVQLLPTDIGPQLKLGTGMIDTAPNPPYLAQVTLMFKDAKYMLDLHIVPLTGAMIISNAAWNQIAPADQAKLTASAEAMEKKLRANAPGLDASSIKAMTERGLEVVTLDAAKMNEFRAEAAKLGATMRGNMVPTDIYDAAVAAKKGK